NPPRSTSDGRFCGCKYQVRAISPSVIEPCEPTTSPPRTVTLDTSVCNSCAPILAARFAISLQATETTPPAMTMQREPQVPVEYGVIAVSPCTTLILLTSMPRIS